MVHRCEDVFHTSEVGGAPPKEWYIPLTVNATVRSRRHLLKRARSFEMCVALTNTATSPKHRRPFKVYRSNDNECVFQGQLGLARVLSNVSLKLRSPAIALCASKATHRSRIASLVNTIWWCVSRKGPGDTARMRYAELLCAVSSLVAGETATALCCVRVTSGTRPVRAALNILLTAN